MVEIEDFIEERCDYITDESKIIQCNFLFDNEEDYNDFQEALKEAEWDNYDQIALDRMTYESY
jgi:hypothetical protein